MTLKTKLNEYGFTRDNDKKFCVSRPSNQTLTLTRCELEDCGYKHLLYKKVRDTYLTETIFGEELRVFFIYS